MGIASFALLVIFSMLPTGLGAMQDAGVQVAQAEIFAKIGAELTSTPMYGDPINHAGNDLLATFTDSTGGGSAKRFPAYFDQEGNEVAAGSNNIIFTVKCVLEPVGSLKYKDIWTPINTGSGVGELRWATVRIGYHKDPGTPVTTTPETEKGVTKRTFLVANRGI